MGFDEYFPDVTFLRFKASSVIMRSALYEKILYDVWLLVVQIFDTTFSLQPAVPGRYFLKLYNRDHLVKTDTADVNYMSRSI